MSSSVLLINHKFPPDTGVATYRVAKFAKYLTKFGCDVHVLTMENGGGTDMTLLDDIAGVESITRAEPLTDRIPVVDTRVNRWIPRMIWQAIGLIRDHDIDSVVHSAPPRIPLIGCLPIKHSTGVPYLFDLRDPFYTENVGSTGQRSETNSPENTYYTVLRFLEPRVLTCASGIILNTTPMREIYAAEYPSLADKMHVIHNGYDPADYEGIEPKYSDKFQIVFPGKFRDDMRWFFEPFSRFVEDREDVVFTHFGRKDRDSAKKVQSVVTEVGVEAYVDFEGYTAKEQVLATIMGAELGLIVSKPGSKTYAGMKTFDYIGCDVPTLGIDDGVSAMRTILSDFPNAHVLERTDQKAIRERLTAVYETRPSSLGNSEAAKQYTQESQAQELHDLMIRLTN